MIQAIVYTSNTGSTEQYARLLGQETDLPVCSLAEARKTLSTGTQIVYLGWVMAGSIQGYADAAGLFQIPMVCAVGMEPDAKHQELREKNGIPQDAALYSQRYVAQIQQYHEGLFRRMIAAGVMRREDPELLALMYDAPILLLLGECDRHPEKEQEIMDTLEGHVRLFYRLFSKQPPEE